MSSSHDLLSVLPQYTARSSALYIGDDPLRLKGLSWFGAEGVGRVPDGLWLHDIDFYLQFISSHGFNAIRLPFALDNVLNNAVVSWDMVKAAPQLRGLGTLDVLEVVIDAAAERGLLVLLDLHRLDSTRWPDDGLWYNPHVSLERVEACWDLVQSRFCNRWNVFGADLFNEVARPSHLGTSRLPWATLSNTYGIHATDRSA